MARILSQWPAALYAAEHGMSANAFYRYTQSLGLGARRADTLSLYRFAVSVVKTAEGELNRGIHSVPQGNEVGTWPSREARGLAQNVTLIYRDRTTGALRQVYYTARSQEGMTRQEAINMAIDAYSTRAVQYDQQLVGAAHTSAYRYQPVGLTDNSSGS